MASFLNKITNEITNTTGSLVGRGVITKVSNSLNQSLYPNIEYRRYLVNGNLVQLISNFNHRSIQIYSIVNQPEALFLNANGQVGSEFSNAHFQITINPNTKHIKFNNLGNYIGFDSASSLPTVIQTKPGVVDKKGIRCEFRLHELFGSNEAFALESVYRSGHYLAVSFDGSIQLVKNKDDKRTHFLMQLVNQNQQSNLRSSISSFEYMQSQEQRVEVDKDKSNTLFPNPEVNENSNINSDSPPEYRSLYPRLP